MSFCLTNKLKTGLKNRISKSEKGHFWKQVPLCAILPPALFFQLIGFTPATDRALSPEEMDMPIIIMPSGTSVPDDIDNPDFWRAWIEDTRGTPLPEDFSSAAHLFKEEGEKLGIFWPAVLVQSVHETNFFRYGGRARLENFNAGGVGITPDERTTTRQNFQTLQNGIRAMLEHVAIYADPYKMEKVIKEQNEQERGVRKFTAKRTEDMFKFIRDKYDSFHKEWPQRPVRITDLGSWAPEEKVKQMRGYGEFGLVRESLSGATLAYAEDPFYGAKLYKIWHRGFSYVRRRYSESQTSISRDSDLNSIMAVSQTALIFNQLLFPYKFFF